MRIAVIVARILVGALFIVSGLIKANDALGFSYKLEEYFAETALNMPFFIPASLTLAIIISIAEIILGFAVLFGVKMKLTLWSLLAMLGFFAWLTYFTASCNDAQEAAMMAGETFNQTCVNDCGCFGDALRDTIGRSLTPWESFTKDIILLALTLIIIAGGGFKTAFNTFKDDKILLPGGFVGVVLFSYFFSWWLPIIFTLLIYGLYLLYKKYASNYAENSIAITIGLVFLLFSYYTLQHLPVTDFRPYKVGEDINKLMASAEEVGLDAPVKAYVYTIKNKQTGEEKTELSNVYLSEKMWNDWDVVTTGAQITISDGYEPKVLSFSAYGLEDEYYEDSRYTASSWELLHDPNYSTVLIAYNLDKLGNAGTIENDGVTGTSIQLSNTFKKDFKRVTAIHEFMDSKGLNMVGLTNSAPELVSAFTYEAQTNLNFLEFDEKELKTIIRSSPGLVLLKNGVVKGKWHFNDIPSVDDLSEYMIKHD